MAQDFVKINNIIIRQPDTGLTYDFETTYTEDSTRVQSGILRITPMFTVEAFGFTATGLTEDEMSLILRQIAKGRTYKLHYRSPYYGGWRDGTFYTGKGSLAIGSWREDKERYDSLSFNMIGVNPL